MVHSAFLLSVSLTLSLLGLTIASPHEHIMLGRRSAHHGKRLQRRCLPRQRPSALPAAANPPAQALKADSTSSSDSPDSDSHDDAPSNGNGRPSNWPSQTQAGAAPAITRASASDPLLSSLSKAYNNKGNPLYLEKKTGEMTYYGQGLGACGDTYDDSSMTAAISQHLFDKWPGATSAQNLNPVCGPFVTGRKTLGTDGLFKVASGARGDGKNFALIGGDGAINCDAVSQCHIPLTATVTHGGKSIIVKIVDRCVGCGPGDIDLTPTAFAKLADVGLGRTDVEWWFNQY